MSKIRLKERSRLKMKGVGRVISKGKRDREREEYIDLDAP